jgi:hypothetical protein
MLRRPHLYVQIVAGFATALKIGTSQQVTIPCQALSHPRTLMGDFPAIERCLKEAVSRLGLNEWYVRGPIALVHLLPKVEGGYTNVELRAFREAMVGAGAAQVYVLVDHPPLTAAQQAEITSYFGRCVL